MRHEVKSTKDYTTSHLFAKGRDQISKILTMQTLPHVAEPL